MPSSQSTVIPYPTPSPRGVLHVVLGPMFSGKTTALIQCMTDEMSRAPMECLAIKPAFDIRYGRDRIASHDGLGVKALPVSEWPLIQPGIRHVFVDEAQFMAAPNFTDDFPSGVETLLRNGINVTACGLDTDWKGMPFTVTQRLSILADRLTMLTARCSACGGKATMNFKKRPNDQIVELGESDAYEARCMEHWHAHKAA